MTEERNELVPESEEEISVGENASSVESADKQVSPFLGSEARTTGGISSSEYTFDSDSVKEESAEEPADSFEYSEEESVFEAEEEYEHTESFTKEKSFFTNVNPDDKDQSALRAMVSFFTVWRRDVGPQDIEAMEERFHLAPVVGALFATILALEMVIFLALGYYLRFPSGLVAPIALLATVLVGSKFIHFDGLVDFGDGMVASGDKEKHIRAMKDSKIGAGGFGVALIVTLATFMLYTNSVSFMAMVPFLFIIPATEVLIKNAMVSAAVYGTPGDGMASSQVRKADNSTLVKSLTTSIILSIVGLGLTMVIYWILDRTFFGILDVSMAYTAVIMFIVLVAGLAISVLVGKFMAGTADKTFGFTSGDVLGATNEIARPIVAFTMVAVYYLILTLITL